ncbi:MAG TPA: hypothetical protein VEY30_12340 [Myxococcaceae bacterium]|nr:hypothetical protein [Myxococcaceae bacterium]
MESEFKLDLERRSRLFAKLLLIHAVVTFAAGIVLVVAPELIPSSVNIQLDPGAYLVCYLLAGCEFGVAALSFGARRLTDPAALRLISRSFIVMHASTALVEVYAYVRGGLSVGLWANVALRVAVCAVFARFGFPQDEQPSNRPGAGK